MFACPSSKNVSRNSGMGADWCFWCNIPLKFMFQDPMSLIAQDDTPDEGSAHRTVLDVYHRCFLDTACISNSIIIIGDGSRVH